MTFDLYLADVAATPDRSVKQLCTTTIAAVAQLLADFRQGDSDNKDVRTCLAGIRIVLQTVRLRAEHGDE